MCYVSDQICLGQMYMNLLSNAVEYTPENGDVKFEVYEEKLAGSGEAVPCLGRGNTASA